jgi:hypothetical protein
MSCITLLLEQATHMHTECINIFKIQFEIGDMFRSGVGFVDLDLIGSRQWPHFVKELALSGLSEIFVLFSLATL